MSGKQRELRHHLNKRMHLEQLMMWESHAREGVDGNFKSKRDEKISIRRVRAIDEVVTKINDEYSKARNKMSVRNAAQQSRRRKRWNRASKVGRPTTLAANPFK